MKGKYSARAANREVARDNEMIAEQADKIAALKSELADVREQLRREQTERGSEIVARSREISRQEISELKEELDGVAAKQAKLNEEVAYWIVDYMVDMDKRHDGLQVIPYPGIRDILTKLVGDAKTTQYLALFGLGLDNRNFRRRKNSGITAMDEMVGRTYEQGQHRILLKISEIIEARKDLPGRDGSPAQVDVGDSGVEVGGGRGQP